MAKAGMGTKGAPSGGHGRGSAADIYTGAAGAKHAGHNGGTFPAAPTPTAGHGKAGSGYSLPSGKPTGRGGC
jgi:hypothetical protein